MLHKISTSSKFSKYKIIQETDYFILQKRKRTFRSGDDPTYRIITQNRPFYEIAHAYDLKAIREGEFKYVREEIPRILPNLSSKERSTWFCAHFTQIALESGFHPAPYQPELPDQVPSEEDGFQPPQQSVYQPNIVDNEIFWLEGMACFFLLASATTLSMMLLRDCAFPVFVACLVGINGALFVLVGRDSDWIIGLKLHHRPPHAGRVTRSHSVASDSDNASLTKSRVLGDSDSGGPSDEEDEVALAGAGGAESKRTVGATKPVAQLDEEKVNYPIPSEIKLPMGRTLSHDPTGKEDMSWMAGDATDFRVRVGPNYARNKKKEKSQEGFYNIVGGDMFNCPLSKLDHLAKNIELKPFENMRLHPEVNDIKGEPPIAQHPDQTVPDYFIVNLQFPIYQPSNPVWGKLRSNGEGFSLVIYHHITHSGRKRLSNPSNNAERLIRKFFEADKLGNPEMEKEIRKRLKCIPKLFDVDDLSMPKLLKSSINSWNEKPFMTGPRCHTFYRGSNYIEVDVDIHKFAYLARTGCANVVDFVIEMTFSMALVVQGEEDDELPEQTLSSGRIRRLNKDMAQTVEGYWETVRQERKASGSPKLAGSASTQANEEKTTQLTQ